MKKEIKTYTQEELDALGIEGFEIDGKLYADSDRPRKEYEALLKDSSKYVNIVSVSGGKDSTSLLLHAKQSGLPFIAVFADTGHEHALTYEYVDYLEEKLDVKIIRVKADFTERIEKRREYIKKHWPKQDVPEERLNEALEALQPTGNPMLDLSLWKGRFASSQSRFCTQFLKIYPIIEQIYAPIWESGKEIIVWQGVRRGESFARRASKRFEFFENPNGRGLYGRPYLVYRPIVDWTARDVFDFQEKFGVKPNPLYKMGMSRVGCMPCINAGKQEFFEVVRNFPGKIDEIERWEELVGKASKRGKSTFFPIDDVQGDGVRERAEWSLTKWGGKEQDPEKLRELQEAPTCKSIYGLCE